MQEYRFNAEQTANIVKLLDRVETKGFKESEAMMDIWTTIEDQKRAIMEEKRRGEENATLQPESTD